MSTQIEQDPTSVKSKNKPLKPLRRSVLYGFVVLAIAVVIIELSLFPNLATNLFFLGLVVFTTLLSLTSLGLSLSGVRARLPVAAKLVLTFAVWGFAALSIIFLALPSLLPSQTAQDADPFVKSVPVVQITSQPNVAPAVVTRPSEPTLVPTLALPTATTLPIANTVPPTNPVPTATTIAPTAVPPTVAPAAPLNLSGNFNNQGVEPVAGKATLGRTADGKFVLRLENFKSAPGPDLFVYLVRTNSPASDDQIKTGVEIAKLKATQGNQNYELASNLDFSQYKAVVIYCKAFSVIFGYANLS